MYCSTTSVPKPRTSRTMGPRFTVSLHTVAASTEGAAGFSRESPQVMSGMAATRSTMYTIRRINFRRATSLPRGTSMAMGDFS